MKPELFPSKSDEAFDKARKTSGDLAAIWSIVSLQTAKDLAYRDRFVVIKQICKHWDDLDPLMKLAVLPYLNDTVTAAFSMNRKMMGEVAPLRISSAYITRRVEVMKDYENMVTLAMKLPWARIKAGAMNELASVYLDFSAAIIAIKPHGAGQMDEKELALYDETVRKITVPFEEKGQDLRGKAFQMASQYAIESTPLHGIADPFFADNPSQASFSASPRLRRPSRRLRTWIWISWTSSTRRLDGRKSKRIPSTPKIQSRANS